MRSLFALLFTLTVLASASAGAAPSPSVEPELGSDVRLATRITVSEVDRPLGELLPELSRKLKVRLTARKETADDKVTLLLKECPAAEALSLLARHLDFQWHRVGEGFQLEQDAVAAGRESALRDREWRAVEGWMEHLWRLSGTPAAQLEVRQSAVEQALAQNDLSLDQSATLAREAAALRDLMRHRRAVPVALEMFHSLTPLQRRQLRSTGSVRLSSAFGGLSPRLIQAAQTALAQPYLRPDQPLYVDAVFRMTDAARDEQPGGSRLARQIRMDAFLTVATETGSTMVNLSPRSLIDVPLPELRPGPPSGGPELDREVAVAFAKDSPPQATDAVIRDRLAEWSTGTLPLGELLRQVHEATGLDVVSDSYIRARVRPSDFTSKMPAHAILDRIAAELGYAWWREGRTLFLRSRSYYNDRPAEVPQRILKPWRARVGRKPSPTLDDLGDLAVPLTDAQARGLNDYWGWYFASSAIPSPSFSGGFFRNRHDLRFWGSLSRRQKQWVLAGNPLSADAMDLRQRLLYLMALTEPADGDWTGSEMRRIPPRPALPSAASIPRSALFRVRGRDVQLQVFANQQGQHVTEIRTVGASRGLRSLGEETLTPVGSPSRAQNLTLVYDPSGSGDATRSTQFYVFSGSTD